MADGQGTKPRTGQAGPAPATEPSDEFEDFMSDLEGFLKDPQSASVVKTKPDAALPPPAEARRSELAEVKKPGAAEGRALPIPPKLVPPRPDAKPAPPRPEPKRPAVAPTPGLSFGSLAAPRLPREAANLVDLAKLPPIEPQAAPPPEVKTQSQRPTMRPQEELLEKLVAETSEDEFERKTPDVPFPKSNLDRMREQRAEEARKQAEAGKTSDSAILAADMNDEPTKQMDIERLKGFMPPGRGLGLDRKPEEDPPPRRAVTTPVVEASDPEPAEELPAVAPIPLPRASNTVPPFVRKRSGVRIALVALCATGVAVAAVWTVWGPQPTLSTGVFGAGKPAVTQTASPPPITIPSALLTVGSLPPLPTSSVPAPADSSSATPGASASGSSSAASGGPTHPSPSAPALKSQPRPRTTAPEENPY